VPRTVRWARGYRGKSNQVQVTWFDVSRPPFAHRTVLGTTRRDGAIFAHGGVERLAGILDIGCVVLLALRENHSRRSREIKSDRLLLTKKRDCGALAIGE
jgi:hypothetical protein